MVLLNYLFSNMILAIVGWICLFILCQSKVIEVNDKGDNSNGCCINGTCPCGSLHKALVHVENDTVINITSSISLPNMTNINPGSKTLNNIIITGNGISVNCSNSGIFTCSNCSNVVIKGINWEQCGNPNQPNVTYAIGFKNVTNISIMGCTFRYSKVCTVVLLQLSSGTVEVYDSRFLFNYGTNSSQCMEIYGTLVIINDDKMIQKYFTYYQTLYNDYYNHNHYHGFQNIYIYINRTFFDHNGASDHVYRYNNYIPSSATLLCFLTRQDLAELHIEDLTVSNSTGLGSSFFYLDIYDLRIWFTNVTFYNNSNGGSIVRITGNMHTSALLRIDSSRYEHTTPMDHSSWE